MSILVVPWFTEVLVFLLALGPVIVVVTLLEIRDRRRSLVLGLVGQALDCPEFRGMFGIQAKGFWLTGTCRVEIDVGDGSLVRIGDVVQKLSARLLTRARLEVAWSRARTHLIILRFGFWGSWRDRSSEVGPAAPPMWHAVKSLARG